MMSRQEADKMNVFMVLRDNTSEVINEADDWISPEEIKKRVIEYGITIDNHRLKVILEMLLDSNDIVQNPKTGLYKGNHGLPEDTKLAKQRDKMNMERYILGSVGAFPHSVEKIKQNIADEFGYLIGRSDLIKKLEKMSKEKRIVKSLGGYQG